MGYDFDATGIEPTGGMMDFSPAPAGWYHLKIVDTTSKWTAANDAMESVKCEIDESSPYKGRFVWHNVTFLSPEKKGAGMAIHFLKCIGEPWEGKIKIEPSSWHGKRFYARLGVKKQEKGKRAGQSVNEVIEVKPATDGIVSSPKNDEVVPF